MRKELDFWKNKVSKLEEECYEKQNEIEELESDNENLKNEIEELKSECEKIHKQLIETEKDAQAHILELKTEIERLSAKENLCEHKDLLAQLQDRHQQDCITINQLNVTIDVLLDKMERLRNNKSMVLKCLSDFTE